jgi:GldM C-terminal domain
MKYLLFLILFSYSVFAQEGRAIISLDKDNIVYRGIDNLLKIGVPGVAQNKIKVTAPGKLSPVEDKPGYYKWNVTGVSGTKAKIMVAYKEEDGKTVIENKEFRLMPIERPYPYLGKYHYGYQSTYKMTRREIAELEINITIDNYYGQLDENFYKPTGFWLYLPKDTIYIEGNVLPKAYKSKIDSLQTYTLIMLNDMRQYNPHSYCLMGLPPIMIEVVDEPLPYKQEDIPRPVIYNTRYETVYRGTGNHFSISVPGAKSYTVSGPGVKQYGNGSFDLNLPEDYKENRVFVDVNAVTKTDSVVKYQYMYIVKNIEIRMLLNGQGCEKCIVQQTLKELENASVSVEYPDINPFDTVIVMSFTVTLPNGDSIQVHGDKMSDEAHFLIEQLAKTGDIITIDKIRYRIPGVDLWQIKQTPVKIMLVE